MPTSSDRPDPVRLGIVGVGHLGRHHARVAASLPGARVAGIHDHHEGRAEEVAREFSLTVLPDLEAVAERADAVVIATPTVSHAEIASFFLDRGKDVLVEKPISTTVAEADALLARAAAAGRIVQVGHVERYNPAVDAVLARIEQPRFLEILHDIADRRRRQVDAGQFGDRPRPHRRPGAEVIVDDHLEDVARPFGHLTDGVGGHACAI